MNKGIWLLTLLCALSIGTVNAQQRYTEDRGTYHIKGRNLPKFVCVRGFYESAFAQYKVGEENFKAFLEQIAIEPNTAASRLVEKGMFLFMALQTEWDDMTPYVNLPPDEYEFYQHRYLRNQVPRLKAIYENMLSDLKKNGISTEALEGYIDREMRSSTGMAVFNESPEKVLEIMDLFEKTEIKEENK